MKAKQKDYLTWRKFDFKKEAKPIYQTIGNFDRGDGKKFVKLRIQVFVRKMKTVIRLHDLKRFFNSDSEFSIEEVSQITKLHPSILKKWIQDSIEDKGFLIKIAKSSHLSGLVG